METQVHEPNVTNKLFPPGFVKIEDNFSDAGTTSLENT